MNCHVLFKFLDKHSLCGLVFEHNFISYVFTIMKQFKEDLLEKIKYDVMTLDLKVLYSNYAKPAPQNSLIG